MFDMPVCITITFIFPVALGEDFLVDYVDEALVITDLLGRIYLI
jgi:hypothetical protein